MIRRIVTFFLSLVPTTILATTLVTESLPYGIQIKIPTSWVHWSKDTVQQQAKLAKTTLSSREKLLTMSDVNKGSESSGYIRVSIDRQSIWSKDFILNLSESDIQELYRYFFSKLKNRIKFLKTNPVEVNRNIERPSVVFSYVRESAYKKNNPWYVRVEYIASQNGQVAVVTSYTINNPKWATTLKEVERSVCIDQNLTTRR